MYINVHSECIYTHNIYIYHWSIIIWGSGILRAGDQERHFAGLPSGPTREPVVVMGKLIATGGVQVVDCDSLKNGQYEPLLWISFANVLTMAQAQCDTLKWSIPKIKLDYLHFYSIHVIIEFIWVCLKMEYCTPKIQCAITIVSFIKMAHWKPLGVSSDLTSAIADVHEVPMV